VAVAAVGRAGEAAAAVAVVVSTVVEIEIATGIATVEAAAGEAAARVAGSRLKIIEIVPGNRANLVGNSRAIYLLTNCWLSARASTQGD
jgi:hypothetical protein